MNKAQILRLLANSAIKSAIAESGIKSEEVKFGRKPTVDNIINYLMAYGKPDTDVSVAVRAYLTSEKMFSYELKLIESIEAARERKAKQAEIDSAWNIDL